MSYGECDERDDAVTECERREIAEALPGDLRSELMRIKDKLWSHASYAERAQALTLPMNVTKPEHFVDLIMEILTGDDGLEINDGLTRV